MTPDEEAAEIEELARRIADVVRHKSYHTSMVALCLCLVSLVEYCGEPDGDKQALYERALRSLAAVMPVAGEPG
jgi:hypothetical protein